jgi:hypothetical protein
VATLGASAQVARQAPAISTASERIRARNTPHSRSARVGCQVGPQVRCAKNALVVAAAPMMLGVAPIVSTEFPGGDRPVCATPNEWEKAE